MAVFTFGHEHVLGTSMELRVATDDSRLASQAEALVLAEIDRLGSIFSTYDNRSQLMRWQSGKLNHDEDTQELFSVLERAEYWRTQSRGAFDCRAAALSKLWRQCATYNRLPNPDELAAIVRLLQQPPYRHAESSTGGVSNQLDQRCVRRDDLPISLDAIAKGYILDRATKLLLEKLPAISHVQLMIGGDTCCLGQGSCMIAIADPHRPVIGASPIAQVRLDGDWGLATSGGYRRFYEIGGQRYSHIIDPRSGQAAATMAAATVIAPSAMDADALATSVSVLGPVDGLDLVEQMDGAACLLVLNSGEVITSSRWQNFSINSSSSRPAVTSREQHEKLVSLFSPTDDEKEKTGLFVKFTLGKADSGRYRRPYVAVWLEDKDGYPVKTAVLWLQTDGPGPRWHRDLTKWYANDRLRKLVEESDLIGTISGATRGPGEYEARFDGNDNAGKPLKPGKYTLCLEAAREHGTHHLIREEVEFGPKPIAKKDLKAGTEFSASSYRYQPYDWAVGK